MNNDLKLNVFVSKCEADFLNFMGMDSMPSYQIVPKEVSLQLAKNQGFESPASVSYDLSTGDHKLNIWSAVPILRADYLVFHEFTHILDAETFSKRDKFKHMANRGYTEYHAAQIDFMKLLGAKSIKDSFSFSMSKSFETYSGTKTAAEFLKETHDHAIELINRQDFPANIETLATTFGIIFNYYGRRSICRMYAIDNLENVDNSSIEKLIRKDTVKALDNFMLGWFDKDHVLAIDKLYQQMAISLAQQYNLA